MRCAGDAMRAGDAMSPLTAQAVHTSLATYTGPIDNRNLPVRRRRYRYQQISKPHDTGTGGRYRYRPRGATIRGCRARAGRSAAITSRAGERRSGVRRARAGRTRCDHEAGKGTARRDPCLAAERLCPACYPARCTLAQAAVIMPPHVLPMLSLSDRRVCTTIWRGPTPAPVGRVLLTP